MKINVGFEMLYDLAQPTPMIMVLGTHFTRASDVIVPDFLTITPSVPVTPYRDGFGNWCSRIVAPAGRIRLAANGVVRDSGMPDAVNTSAVQHAVEDLPAEIVHCWSCDVAEVGKITSPPSPLPEAGRGSKTGKTTPSGSRPRSGH